MTNTASIYKGFVQKERIRVDRDEFCVFSGVFRCFVTPCYVNTPVELTHVLTLTLFRGKGGVI